MNNANIEPELNSLISKIAIEMDEDSKEIEMRRKRIEKNDALLRALRGRLSTMHTEVKSSEYGTKTGIIRDAIARMAKPQFIQDEIESELRRVNPAFEINRNRVRAAL